MKNKKLLELIKYEVEKAIIAKWFIILNIILLVIGIIATNISEIQKYIDINSSYINIEVIDNDNLIYNDLFEAFSKEEYKSKVGLKKVEDPTYSEEDIIEHYITINVEKSNENGLYVKITTLKEIDEEYSNAIEEVVKQKRNELLTNKIGITQEEIDFIMSEPAIEEIVVGLDIEDLSTKSTIQFISAYANLIILFLLLSKLQTQIMQEKTSKSSEYVLTNINEKQYLLLKILTIIIVFIIQIVLIIAYYIIGIIINNFLNIGSFNIESSEILTVNSDIVKMIVVQLILSISSIFIQCLIQAAIASKTGNAKEGSHAMTILIILNMAVYMYAATYGVEMNLSSSINNVLCIIPIVSTYLIPVMMIYNSASTVQIILAILLNLFLIPITINKCSKIVKNGILGYDSKDGGTK